MIQLKCMLLSGAMLTFFSCKPALKEQQVALPQMNAATDHFVKYELPVVLEDKHIRMPADRYALTSMPPVDSVLLIPVYYSLPQTDGRFYLLSASKGEQFNLNLPGDGQAFISAATTLYMNFQPKRKNYVVQGKAWIVTGRDSVTIKTDELTIIADTGSSINIDNYADAVNAIISLKKGSANVMRYGDTISLKRGWEIWIGKTTGKVKTKIAPYDVTLWTNGGFRHWDMDINYVMNEIGRLYSKNVFIDKIKAETYVLNFDYRSNTLTQAAKLYNDIFPGINMEVSDDSIKLTNRFIIKKKTAT